MNRDECKELMSLIDISLGGISGDNQLVQCLLHDMPELQPDAGKKLHNNGNKKKSMSIKVLEGESSLYKCFGCGAQGKLSNLLLKMASINKKYLKAYEYITSREDESALSYLAKLEEKKKAPKSEGGLKKVWDDALLEKHCQGCHNYVLERGVSLTSAKMFEVGFDIEEKRAVFPIRERSKLDFVGMVGRTIYSEEKVLEYGIPKYKNYKLKNSSWKKSEYLYGEHLLPVNLKTLILVEGILDTILIYQSLVEHGLTDYGVVGIMGNNPSDSQVRNILRWTDKVLPMFDNDKGGEMALKFLVKKLRGRLKVFNARWDANDAGEDFLLGGSTKVVNQIKKESYIF